MIYVVVEVKMEVSGIVYSSSFLLEFFKRNPLSKFKPVNYMKGTLFFNTFEIFFVRRLHIKTMSAVVLVFFQAEIGRPLS